MSVLILGMEMPKSCDECPCFSQDDACDVTGSWKWADEFDKSKERLPDCPLIPVPPHGTLKLKQPSNADRIRSMSDEELAKWMAINTDCFFCKVKNENICSLDEGTCTEEWLWWLKNPAEEGE